MLAFAFTAAARLERAVTSSSLLEMGRPVPAGWQRAPRRRRARDAHVTDEYDLFLLLVFGNSRALRGRWSGGQASASPLRPPQPTSCENLSLSPRYVDSLAESVFG